jgi:hypothetical protein
MKPRSAHTLHAYCHKRMGAQRSGPHACYAPAHIGQPAPVVHVATPPFLVGAQIPSRPTKATWDILRTYDDARAKCSPEGYTGMRLVWDAGGILLEVTTGGPSRRKSWHFHIVPAQPTQHCRPTSPSGTVPEAAALAVSACGRLFFVAKWL